MIDVTDLFNRVQDRYVRTMDGACRTLDELKEKKLKDLESISE